MKLCDCSSGRFSVEVEKKSSTETEPKRFSEPVQIFSQVSSNFD